MSSLDSRLGALYLLKRFRGQRSWTSATITSAQTKYHLDPRDTALASTIAKSVLEHQSLIDYYLDHFSNIPLTEVRDSVLDILRIGIVQILYMDRIPVSAAVDTSVSCCRETGNKSACGYVNAVLRNVIRSQDSLPVPDQSDMETYLSIVYSHPKWLISRLLRNYGQDHTVAFLNANNGIDSRTVYANSLLTDKDAFKSILSENELSFSVDPLWPDAIQLPQLRRVEQIPGYDDGLFYVQDPAAHEVAVIAGISSGMSILDCCAAPGGKSVTAALAMENTGLITACDINEKKLHRITDNCQRLHITNVNCFSHDARDPFDNLFDVVLADVPCSGMGVIRKRPEVRYKSEEEIAKLPEIQYAILNNVSSNVKSGGVLLYSTCTVVKEENEDVINRFLSEHAEFSLAPFNTCGQSSDGMFTFWPQSHHTDGFFICKMKKTV